MSLTTEESNNLKEKIADIFLDRISSNIEMDQVMLSRVVVDYFRLGERGPCGTLSLRVRPIIDNGFRMVPFRYIDKLFRLLNDSSKSKPKGYNLFSCIGISMDYDELVFRIEFENLQGKDVPSPKQIAESKKKLFDGPLINKE